MYIYLVIYFLFLLPFFFLATPLTSLMSPPRFFIIFFKFMNRLLKQSHEYWLLFICFVCSSSFLWKFVDIDV